MTRLAIVAALLLVPLDVIHLRNGGRLEGRILEQTDEFVRIELAAGGEATVARADIESIEQVDTPEDELQRRRDALAEDDHDGWAELARWAESQGMDALDLWRRAGEPHRSEFLTRVEEFAQRRRRDADRSPGRRVEILEDLCERAPESTEAPGAMLELGRHHLEAESWAQADWWLREALQWRPGWADAWLGLETCYARQGDWRTVASLLEESGRDASRWALAEEARDTEDLLRVAEICRAFDAPAHALRVEERYLGDHDSPEVARRVAEGLASRDEWGRALWLCGDEDLAWRARYAGVIEPDEALMRVEPLVNEYFEADDARRREIARALAAEPRPVVEAAVRRGRRYEPAETGEQTHTVHIEQGDYDLEYTAYVPPTYHPAAPMPLLISLHGAHGTGPNHFLFWHHHMERRQDMILIAPTAARYGWGSSRQGHAAVLGVRADAMRRWNVDASRIYLDGASMGGNGTFEVALRHPGLFAAIAPRVGAPIRLEVRDERTGRTTVRIRFVENLTATPVYYIVGALDDRVEIEQCRMGRDAMRRHDVPLVYREFETGGHEWFPQEDEAVLAWMEQQRLALHPERFEFMTDEEEFNRSYWVEITDPEGRHAIDFRHQDREGEVVDVRPAYRPESSVVAEVDRERNRLEIREDGVDGLRIYLHDDLVDFSREVEIRVNGRRVHREVIQPDVGFMLEHARTTGNREQLYWAAVDVTVP